MTADIAENRRLWRTCQLSEWLLTDLKEIPPELDPQLREALAWVVRLHSGDATTADAEALRRWRDSAPGHEMAFRDAVRLWRSFREAARELAGENGERQSGPLDQPRMLSRRNVFSGAMAASVIAGGLAIRPPLQLWSSLEELSADYRTGKGEQRDIALSDGFSLKMNTQTSVAVRAGTGPHIEVLSGEAAISASSSMPVLVDASGGRIAAVQATFNVRCLNGGVTVSCIDGAVDVTLNGQDVHIARNEQVTYSPAMGLGKPAPGDPKQFASWQEGLLVVHDKPLESVIAEVNRYRPGRIVLLNNDLKNRMITGTFRLDRLDDFVGQAHALFGAKVRSLPGGVVLLS